MRRGLVKGVAKAPDILESDTETMISTNVTGLINMTQVGGWTKTIAFCGHSDVGSCAESLILYFGEYVIPPLT